ncbi:hypothetical protein EVAR_24225_1 [Eumeta japonica]|uniref:Uncharacterized protein n=1 Tax=Eumeta variegata TaxID=151549 RepID=A0A4C1W663_EUMVA|nr:hypothetical protein EVAR_24225_1 [Eumeta japonica]
MAAQREHFTTTTGPPTAPERGAGDALFTEAAAPRTPPPAPPCLPNAFLLQCECFLLKIMHSYGTISLSLCTFRCTVRAQQSRGALKHCSAGAAAVGAVNVARVHDS